jgi:arginine repressor
MVAEALDSSSWREIVGTLAGDNTIFMATNSAQEAENMRLRIQELLK